MSILIRVIAITVFCVLLFITKFTKSKEIITAYDFACNTIENNDEPHKLNSESYGRSHRFYFTLGERADGDRLLKVLEKERSLKLSYVLVKVYQESEINRIHLVDGEAGQRKVSIDIYANDTKYLQYNTTLYGK